ncbi:glucose dehydrogenase [Thermoleophilia bacterium SCSIO 60948]|nr:glucose dehydrogenase [Thermoleophilia bacterium SCSIO 60948]
MRIGIGTSGRRTRVLALFAAIGAVALGASGSPASAGSAAIPVDATPIGEFNQPIYATGAPGYDNLLFVVERAGRIRVMRGQRQVRRPFLDIAKRVGTDGEGGLLSVAFPPNYRDSGRFYVYFTDNRGDVQVDEYRRTKDSAVRARPGSRRAVITVPHPNNATNHNGGTAMFGPDGKLWIAPGDGGSTPQAAQNLSNLRGKLLRIDPVRPNGRPGHLSPASNPYVGEQGRDEIWARGLRNPFRFSFDGGYLAIADVGQDRREEVNYLTPADARGGDFGWPVYEGVESHPTTPGLIDPIFDYEHMNGGGAAITGGVVMRDPRFSGDLAPDRGRYLYADSSGALGSNPRGFIPLPDSGTVTDDRALAADISGIVAFAEGPKRRVYVVSLGQGVFRLDPPA